ncbi:MAG: ABC transporter permease [Herminiimonas sp.]|nr:ABC transporter permease [Herminiimonas sp.]
MFFIAIKMLLGDRAKYAGLIFGITFTSFLVTFAGSYFSGFMTRGFSLITENEFADVWVMDPAVRSVDQSTNLPRWTLDRVRSVDGVRSAVPLVVGSVEARFPDGRFQSFQIIGLDDATLAGAPALRGGRAIAGLRAPNTVAVSSGGTSGKLATPQFGSDQWTHDQPHLGVPLRDLNRGDELLVNDHTVRVTGQADALPRFPPRPLLYMTASHALAMLMPVSRPHTFILATARAGISPAELADRITAKTHMRARTAANFKSDTVHWLLVNSEDVGDIASMIILAMSVGFGVTGVMLYMFTNENLSQYAVLSAMGATRKMLLMMIFAQAGLCALVGTGLGLGLCGIAGQLAERGGYPFRVMWFTPLVGGAMVLIVSAVAAALSAWPVLKLQPALVFAGR